MPGQRDELVGLLLGWADQLATRVAVTVQQVGDASTDAELQHLVVTAGRWAEAASALTSMAEDVAAGRPLPARGWPPARAPLVVASSGHN